MSDDLAEYAITRDPSLRDALVIRHLPLAKFVARKMSASLPDHIELDDLVSYGSIGLIDAISKFDPTRGVKFSTYAVTRIRGSILDGLQSMDWAPKQVTSRVRAMRRLRAVMINELGQWPTPAQLAERMGATEIEVRGWLLDDVTTRVLTLETPPSTEDNGTGHDAWSRDATEEAEQAVAGEVGEIRTRMSVAIAALPARERAVLMLYYRDSLTLKEIATQLDVSVSSATQTHTRLVESIRGRLATLGSAA